MKKIGIIGGGSVGLLFSSYLAECFDVTLYTRTEEQAEAVRREGVIRVVGEMKRETPVQARTLSEGMANEDLIIVAVKQYHLENILSIFKNEIKDDIPVLFVQNGMGHIHKIEKSAHKHVFLGIVEHGALKTSLNEIHHTGAGVTNIACYRGNSSSINRLFEKPIESFPFMQQNDWYEMLINKLIVNSCINPLTALYRVTNGQLIHNPFYHENLKIVFSEIIKALRITDGSAYWAKVIHICRQTTLNRSSMLRDIEEGRETEVDAILGYVLQEAETSLTAMPSVHFLYKSIKGLEKAGEGQFNG
ncbi:2-dehydropantoate 2-reductase [Priestia abyssalis]|uniref:2-dehydropantoate 2-reductase n=1 Tax=Priestia abyssalis TaxID=1221450 RepID=UPI0009954F25|nr:2-dehydropantoate 2-reductase [Priestia abyssalis]